MNDEEAQEVKVEDEDDVEADALKLMQDVPKGEPQPDFLASIPYRKLVIGVTDAGLIDILHNDVKMLELAEVARQLAQVASNSMQQQAANVNRARAAGHL
ncbi:MAG TPA: hypothetical protein VMY35_08895 [Phycisphaerae bacterium]|nr:hypothetical protein [Phycisphaerae bacterium]